jgi:Macrocin-O-methyltransferase (TylF)
VPLVANHPSVDLYLDLMTKVLTRYGFDGKKVPVIVGAGSYERFLWEMLQDSLVDRRVGLVEDGEFRAELREDGRDWPVDAESMIGLRRMANVRHCVETALADGVPGDLIETGVWRGGTCIFMRAILAAHGDVSRTVWVADSFQGLPLPDPEDAADAADVHHSFGELSVSVSEVQDNFRRYGLLDDRVRFLEGWFKNTLPAAPIERLAVLRLDGDMYSSTMDGLDALYDKVSPGGFVIVDDYGAVPACAEAVHDFRDARGITDAIETIDWAGSFWRKTS